MSIQRLPAKSERPTPSYVTGDVIGGRYKLERKFAEGGMGELWISQNTSLEIPVALKLLRVEGRSGCAPERLMLEARATAKLHHPAVVRVFDCGTTEQDDPFLVMELLSGESLRDLLDREETLPAERAVQLLLPILDGLSAAHLRGIVHRDLKPDNVFLAEEDGGRLQPKVLDFGVAKMLERPTKRLVTRRGTVVGSPDYMSPEQARGQEIDARTDVWAACVSLYEAIAGFRPFMAETQQAVMLAIISQEPTKLDERHGVDASLWAILTRGLAKERDDRFATIRELGQALAEWLLARGVQEDVCAASLRAAWLDVGEARALRVISSPHLIPVPLPREGVAHARSNPTEDASSRVLSGTTERRTSMAPVTSEHESRVSRRALTVPSVGRRGALWMFTVVAMIAGAFAISSPRAQLASHEVVTATARAPWVPSEAAGVVSVASVDPPAKSAADDVVDDHLDRTSPASMASAAKPSKKIVNPRRAVVGGGRKLRTIDFGF